MRYKAAAVQFTPKPGDPSANLQKGLELVREAARQGAKLVVMPELFATGYDPARAAKEPESAKTGNTLHALGEEAKRRDLWIVASVAARPEPPATRPTLSTVLVAPEGVSDPFHKVYLWGEEKEHFEAGAQVKVFNSRLGRLGPVGCYDIEFPEVARGAAVKGAQVLVVSAAFFTEDIWDLATRARALENGCWVVAANYTGPGPGGQRFCGRARIVAPDGKVLADAGKEEGVAVESVDPIAVLEHRRDRPYLTERKRLT